ncbi:MAG: ATP phosphoribosyltransferase [Oscillospiraceae bacterium]|nr:ATP phosphoribosyltransferase [Oscillospiraceae bacterium]
MENRKVRLALTKGRIESKAVDLLEKIGYDVSELRNKGRRLILSVPGEDIEVVLAKPTDVITYVEHGVCDLGVVGKDTIMEHGGKFFEISDLGFGKCRFALAVKKGTEFYKGYGVKTVATKYPEVTRKFFEAKGIDVDIVKIEGSVELAPLVGLSDGIVDIVETGTTLKENGLEVYDHVADISARLIVNTVSMKLKQERISEIVRLIEENCDDKNN